MGRFCGVGCRIIFVLTLAVLLALPVLAQLPTATILGSVKDTSGASVPGATITIQNTDTGAVRTVMTDNSGSYDVPELLTGHYSVKAEHQGFKTVVHSGITLDVAQEAKIDFSLDVGTTTQEVVVTGEAPIVNTQDATLGGLVNEQYMTDLPVNGRNYVDLSLIEPGINQDKNSATGPGSSGSTLNPTAYTSFSADGAPVRSNLFTLDGAITNTQEGRGPANAAAGSTLGMDGIKEFRIITSQPQAEYGLSMGSQVVVVSKSGTNQFHGDAFDYLRNSALAARNFFATTKAPLRKNQFGGALGGPIKKDKTFFFATYEGLRWALGVTNTETVLAAGCHAPAGATVTAAQCPDLGAGAPPVVVSAAAAQILPLMPLPNTSAGNEVLNTTNTINENYGQMRVDHNFSASDTLFARYTIDDALATTPSPIVLQDSTVSPNRNQWLTLGWNHIFSPTVLNTFRFSYSRTMVRTLGSDAVTGPSIVTGQPLGNICISGENCPGQYATIAAIPTIPTRQVQNIYTLSDDINWTSGKHAFKFGVLLNRWNQGVESNAGADGQISYQDPAHFFLSEPNLVELRAPGSIENRFSIYDTIGLYGQDSWRATPRLTVNLGLRWEFATVPHELHGIQSHVVNDFTDPFVVGPIIAQHELHNFSPRVAVAYDVFGNGKTAFRGGAGIFYDIGNIGPALEQDVIGSPPFSGLVDIEAGSNPPVQKFWPVSFPLPPSISSGGANVTTPQFIDYNWKGTYMIQWNASVQQQLPWDMGLLLGYVGNHGVHLPTVRDSNPIFPTSTVSCSSDPSGVCVNGVVDLWDDGLPSFTPINPNMPSTINVATVSVSRYNALQVVLQKRISHGLQLQTSYVYSKLYDDTQGQENVRDCSVGAGIQGTDTLHPRQVDWGPACFNVPNNWTLSAVYHFPTIANGSALLKAAANGWWIASIASIQSGEPIDVVLNGNRSNQIDQSQQDRANVNTAAFIAANPCTTANPCKYTPVPFNASSATSLQLIPTGGIEKVQFFTNPAMFSMSPETMSPASEQSASNPFCPCTIGQLGNSPRDFLQGPHARDWSFSLVKDTKVGFLGEAGLVQFRAEAFNFLNHPDFAAPSTGVFTGNQTDLGPFSEKPGSKFGLITKTVNLSRQIQLALRIEF